MDSTDEMEYTFTLSELMKRNNSTEKTNGHNDDEEGDDGGGGGSVSFNGAIENKDEWFQDREAYERNFNSLQEQLLTVMVEKQQLVEESKKFDKHSIEELEERLEEERNKRRTAEQRLKIIMSKRRKRNSESSATSVDLNVDELSTDITDDVNKHDDTNAMTEAKHKFRSKWTEYKIYFWNIFHERISDFINDDDIQLEPKEEEELSVRRLKENVNRFTAALQPIQGHITTSNSLFAWKNPWITFSIFLIYSYAVYHEMAIPLVLFLLLLQLSWNYMLTRDIGKRVLGDKNQTSRRSPKEDQGSVSLTERYQLVLLIAKKVQNNVGDIADSMEKMQNLLLWQHKTASTLLFKCILASFVVSLILPTNKFFMLVGLLTGIKLFIITPIYTKWPKVQKRYDDFQSLWEELPTHKENMRRKIQETIEINDEDEALEVFSNNSTAITSSPSFSSSHPPTSPTSSLDHQLEGVSHETVVFCDRFQLPITEAPLFDWQEGRRCTMMDKESPLSSMKHGRMYLTPSYLCFERNQFHSKKNIAIDIHDIVYVKKAKPISFMPGQGMAIEVQVKEMTKPYIFGAMMSRDEAYESIIKTGRLLNLSWSNT